VFSVFDSDSVKVPGRVELADVLQSRASRGVEVLKVRTKAGFRVYRAFTVCYTINRWDRSKLGKSSIITLHSRDVTLYMAMLSATPVSSGVRAIAIAACAALSEER
jgi:hypothetical protein